MTPLHVAGRRGRFRIVDSLSTLGDEISTKDNDGVGIFNQFELTTFSSLKMSLNIAIFIYLQSTQII